ncbi:uncharacterized protein ATNIH1004_009852 [Aspergillus tanneri]|uniref:Uncharacterized protein n=1 Tax=Aspergillus tanneri TaxID=1220188 RepID=A0A5M9MCC2_9EURO|nr:uncharacterized protein ATNIH1004_009852 [Aspergillus tanneri]KAA8643090.1 hypothetical protein ATNIH1004_009852 [Aspergillus tanneri]
MVTIAARFLSLTSHKQAGQSADMRHISDTEFFSCRDMGFSLQRAAASNPRCSSPRAGVHLDIASCGRSRGYWRGPFEPSPSLLYTCALALYIPTTTTDGSFTALVARRLSASHNHLTGEVNGGVTREFDLISS